MSVELRIKLAHIGMEPAIIRKHERRIKKRLQYHRDTLSNRDPCGDEALRHSLIQHRRWNVRNEARATHLACAFIKETPYRDCEETCDVGKRVKHIDHRTINMIRKYDSNYAGADRKTVEDAYYIWITE